MSTAEWQLRWKVHHRYDSSARTVTLALVLLWHLGVGFSAAAEQSVRTTHVVVVHGADFFLPGAMEADGAMRDALSSASEGPITFHAEPLNAIEAMQVENEELKSQELRARYSRLRIELVIAASSVGLKFVERHRSAIWPQARVLYYGVADHAIIGHSFAADVAGISLPFDMAGTLDLAVRLQPKAQRLIYVAGDAPYDQVWLPKFRRAVEPYRDRLLVIEKIGLPMRELQQELDAIADGAIVFYSSMFSDVDGGTYVPRDVARVLSKGLNVPLYAMHGTYMGTGVLGGSMVDYTAHGREAGLLAARVLNVNAIDTEQAGAQGPMRSASPSLCTVDARQMNRWELPLNRLPDDCSVRFAEPSIWQTYRSELLVSTFALIALALLAWALTRQRLRRKEAEVEASARRTEVAHAARLALLGEITASVVHEVSQPLSAILNNAEAASMLLDRADPSLEEIRLILADIRSDNLRANEVVRRLRQLLKERALQTEQVDLNQIATSVLALTRPDALRRHVTIRSQLDPALPSVSGDPVQLQQVLLNLVINAMDAMTAMSADERVLDICTGPCDTRFAAVAVIDNGSGIDPQALPKLFDSFFTTKHDGMGLGLSVARTIVEAHGGAIWAENNARRGAAFHFTVPLFESSVEPGVLPSDAIRRKIAPDAGPRSLAP